jgi:hypothetical protein
VLQVASVSAAISNGISGRPYVLRRRSCENSRDGFLEFVAYLPTLRGTCGIYSTPNHTIAPHNYYMSWLEKARAVLYHRETIDRKKNARGIHRKHYVN